MGNAPPPQDSGLTEEDIKCSRIEFYKIWGDEEKYQLSRLEFVVSNFIPRDWFYHDLKGVSLKPPLFETRSIIGSCNFTRQHGERHEFHGIWEGEMKPNDTISCSTLDLKHSITIWIRDKSKLGEYIKDPDKSTEFVRYRNEYKDKTEWLLHEFGELEFEITKNEYCSSKKSDTIWSKYKVKIPQSLIKSALETASIASKPQIIEKYVEPEPERPKQEEKALESPQKVLDDGDVNKKVDRIQARMRKMEDRMSEMELEMNKMRASNHKNIILMIWIGIGVWYFNDASFGNTMTFITAFLYVMTVALYFCCCR